MSASASEATALWRYRSFIIIIIIIITDCKQFINAGAMSLKFGDGHSLKRYAPGLLAGVIFDVYDQDTQTITELDIKLNKWDITVEKLYRQEVKVI